MAGRYGILLMNGFEGLAAQITEFKIDLYNALIEKMTRVDGKRVIVTLLDGTELECEVE